MFETGYTYIWVHHGKRRVKTDLVFGHCFGTGNPIFKAELNTHDLAYWVLLEQKTYVLQVNDLRT